MAPEAASRPPEAPPPPPPSVTVGILTYQRPASLETTLRSLVSAGVTTDPTPDRGWRLAEIVVVDNDAIPTARDTVSRFAADHGLEQVLRHAHEPTPGLAAARNRALDEARGDVLVFIDDDERATDGWPGGLVRMLATTDADLVGAPVLTEFTETPPTWVVDGGFFVRDDPPHGSRQPWLRSGNLAIDLASVRRNDIRFDPRFSRTGGEDVAFSFAAVERGLALRWAEGEAVVEDVGPDRTTAAWILRRSRRAAAAYTRAQLAGDPRPRTRPLVVARGLAHLGRAGATVALGAATLHWGRVAKGVAGAWRGVGLLEGLLDRRSDAYGGGGTKPHAQRQQASGDRG